VARRAKAGVGALHFSVVLLVDVEVVVERIVVAMVRVMVDRVVDVDREVDVEVLVDVDREIDVRTLWHSPPAAQE
jgi:hypothetical protein